VNIFAVFFSQPRQIPVLSGGVNRFSKMTSVYSSRTSQTDGQTDRQIDEK